MAERFVIVGQGIAGSLLGLELMNRGHEVEIWDDGNPNTSSKKAAGIFNPITGREMKKTWMADQLFPFLQSYYSKLENKLNTNFFHSLPIYRPFHSMDEQNDWMTKAEDALYKSFIDPASEPLDIDNLQDPFGGLHLKQGGFVDVPAMLSAVRDFFKNQGVLHEGDFNEDERNVTLIYCEGTYVSKNYFWKELPFRPVRGEIVDIKCDLPPDRIYNRGVFMVPKGDIFRVGSTYDHSNLTFEPQAEGVKQLEQRLAKLYSGKYEIIDASAGVRPATHDRKPYIGRHPENKGVGIFNGFGTKGVSLVPYFSKLFVDSIEGKGEIPAEANVSRVF